jgi:hypothetical protein
MRNLPHSAAHLRKMRGPCPPPPSASPDCQTTPTTLTAEYAQVADAFGWNPSDFTATNRMAAQALLADAGVRASVLSNLDGADAP